LHFDPALLYACPRQSPEWKNRHSFPEEVLEILGEGGSSQQIPVDKERARHTPQFATVDTAEWRQVIVDSPMRLFALLVRGWQGEDRLQGFAVRPEGWGLQGESPCFSLEEDSWLEVFPDLAAEPPTDVWRQAWRAWCQARHVPGAEAEACQLERLGVYLRITMPHRVVDRLRAARSDALKGEGWILAGEGPVRPLARLEIVEAY
jgi:hypothetical protein